MTQTDDGDSLVAVSALTFEEAQGELEQINRQLADGKAPLEAQMSLHERAAELDAHCRSLLDTFEARLRQIEERRNLPRSALNTPVPTQDSTRETSDDPWALPATGGFSDEPPF